MNTKALRDTAVSLLIGMVGASHVLALETGNQALNAGADTDVFTLHCPSNTSYAKARVYDLNPVNASAKMRVWVIGPNNQALSPYDPAEGSPGNPSSWTANVTDGVQDYTVEFEKDSTAAENYKGTATCYNVNNGSLNNGATLQ